MIIQVSTKQGILLSFSMFMIWYTMFDFMSAEILLLKKLARCEVYGRANFVFVEFGIVLGFMVLLNHLNVVGTLVPEFHVGEVGQIRDKLGRERIFHGLNVVMKGCPWHPHIEQFDPQMSFCDTDIALLKQWGMNVVRLAIMWPGVEPVRGQFNSTYLDIMRSIVEKLHKAGIYSLLEFHQDLFTSEFCGEGVPGWVLDRETSFHKQEEEGLANNETILEMVGQGEMEESTLDGKLIPYAQTFPEPLSARWPIDEFEGDGKERHPEQCGKHNWFWYYFSYAVSRAFQDLYENRWGWSDLLARYWKTVAYAFHDQAGVLGYELINEPWPGNFFRHPSLLLPGVADHRNLAKFYDKLQTAVRSMDPGRILFIETITFDDLTCGFATVPGGNNFRNRTVLSYHYYSPPNLSPIQAFSERVKESRRLGCGAMLTEFFIANLARKSKWSSKFGTHSGVKTDKDDGEEKLKPTSWTSKDKVDEVLSAADEHIQSWIGWEYKAFLNKTGSMVEQSLFNPDGEINMLLSKKLARTYPQAVCGKIISYAFDPLTSHFSLYYFAENSSLCSTEIFVHRGFYYPLGLHVALNPIDCIQVLETERIIYINHTLGCPGFVVSVSISALGS